MSESYEIKVGSALWRFDESHRRYTEPPPGGLYGELIWRRHWLPEEVIGETSRSWLVGSRHNPVKLAKAAFRDGACPVGWARSEEQIAKLEWVHDNQRRIADHIGRMRGDHYDVLVEVARLVGYEPRNK